MPYLRSLSIIHNFEIPFRETTLPNTEKELLLNIIHQNTFTDDEKAQVRYEIGRHLLEFYTNYRKVIITPGTQLYQYKQEYDHEPTINLRRASK